MGEQDIPGGAIEAAATRQYQDMSRIFNELDRVYHRLAQRAGLSDCAFWIMYAVREHDRALTQKRLIESWSYAKQTVSSALKLLVERQLIHLDPARDDHRSKLIRLTGAGERFSREHVEPTMLLERRALEGLGPDEREELLRLLSRYVTRLQAEVDQTDADGSPTGPSAS